MQDGSQGAEGDAELVPGEVRTPGHAGERSGRPSLHRLTEKPRVLRMPSSPARGRRGAARLGGASPGAAPAVLWASGLGAGGGKGWSHVGRSKTRGPRARRAEPERQEPQPGRAASGAPVRRPGRAQRLQPSPAPVFGAQRGRKASAAGDTDSAIPGLPALPLAPREGPPDLPLVPVLRHGSFGEEDIGMDLPGGEAGIRPFPPYHLLGRGAGAFGGRLPAETEATEGPATGHGRRPARPGRTA
jgi:hypothetical protein